MGSANKCDQFAPKREQHKYEDNTMTSKEWNLMEIFSKRPQGGTSGRSNNERVGIINTTVTPLPVVYCSPKLSEGRQSSRLSEIMHTSGEMFTVSLFTSSLVFSLYMIHGLVTGGVSW